jgi:two-component system alkaline phosphatase synthesis response regulator PhoP
MSDTAPFKTALLLEDDRNLQMAISVALRRLHMEVKTASTLKKARDHLKDFNPELLLLDRMVPDGDGLELCIELRERRHPAAILILSAAGETQDRVMGLNQGADDYLAKPFAWEELEARIFALSRRKKPDSARIAESLAEPPIQETWLLDESRLRILGARGWTELTPLEFKLVSHLIKAGGAIVSREELLKDVWGFSFLPKTRTVDFFLSRLRKRLEKDAENPKHLLTVRGAGYRFEKTESESPTLTSASKGQAD